MEMKGTHFGLCCCFYVSEIITNLDVEKNKNLQFVERPKITGKQYFSLTVYLLLKRYNQTIHHFLFFLQHHSYCKLSPEENKLFCQNDPVFCFKNHLFYCY